MSNPLDGRVYVTRPLPDPGTRLLSEAGLEVDQHVDDHPPTPAELLDHLGVADALLSLLTDKVDGPVMDAAPRLQVIANLAVGFDNIDVSAATERGIVVSNTPDVLTEATADLAWALLLAAARRVAEGDRLVRAGQWQGWSPTQLIGPSVQGKTLGVFGMGKIGTAVARRARGFDMRVIYHNRRPNEGGSIETNATFVTFDALLDQSDFLSINAPLNDESRHAIGADELARMRSTAVLVNTARGPLVDEAALVDALRAGTIAAAGLDVFEHEPAVHAGLADLGNVVLLPHLGSATAEARAAMVTLCCENIVAVLAGARPPTPLNPEVLS
jgi:glyoxylate reductase